MSRKSYRSWTPDQTFLLPPSPRDWLGEDHLVFFVMDVVDTLDIGEIDRKYQEKDHRGERPYDPRMLLGLLIYGYCVGVRSSRRLERATWEDVAVRVLTADNHPDHSVIAGFRSAHLSAIARLFTQVLELCVRAGLVKLGRVALDGTKIKANASKHKAMSYRRMQERERDLADEVAKMLAEAETADAQDDAVHGKGRRGDELPKELKRREDRLARLREAKAALEAEARAAREAELAEREAAKKDPPDDPPPPALPRHQVKHNAAGEPKPEAQRNFTDPESRIMKSGKDFVQAYNGQAVVDEAHQIIVAAGLTNQPPDAEHLPAMLDRVEENLGRRPVQALADAGYWSAENAAYLSKKGIDALISVAREKHVLDGEKPWPEGDPRAAMHARLRAPPGRVAYARRKVIVEPVFGQIKGARGLRQFLMRGLERVRGEWLLDCMCHNILKLFRYGPATAIG